MDFLVSTCKKKNVLLPQPHDTASNHTFTFRFFPSTTEPHYQKHHPPRKYIIIVVTIEQPIKKINCSKENALTHTGSKQ